MFNFSQIGADRKWLQDLLLSDTDTDGDLSDEDDYIRTMLKDHVKEQKYRAKYYQNADVRVTVACNLSCRFVIDIFLIFRTLSTDTMGPGCCRIMTISTNINGPSLAYRNAKSTNNAPTNRSKCRKSRNRQRTKVVQVPPAMVPNRQRALRRWTTVKLIRTKSIGTNICCRLKTMRTTKARVRPASGRARRRCWPRRRK